MPTRHRGIGIGAALIALLGAWAAVRSAQADAEVHRTLQTVQREAADATRRTADLRAQLAKLPQQSPESGGVGGDARPQKVASNPATLTNFSPGQRDVYRRRIDRTYAAFFIRVGLTSDQVDRFHALYAEHEAWSRDYLGALREQHLSPTSSGADAIRKQEDDRFDAARQDLLGVDMAQKLKDYESTAPYRDVVDMVAANLALTDTPLTPAQAKRLQLVLQSANVTGQNEKTTAWDLVLTQASGFLQPRQLTELRARAHAAQQWAIIRQLDQMIAQTSFSAK